jgi:hypothetical protein
MLSICAALAADRAAADVRNSTCRVISGFIVPECNGGICNQGKITGDLTGRFTSRTTSIYPGGSGWVFTAWTRIDLDKGRGRIETIDQGTTAFDAKGGPDLANSTEVLSISEATGSYEDNSGMLIISGGHQVGKPVAYTGQLCHRMRP